MGVMLLALVFLLTRYGSLMVSGQAAAIGRERPSVVIDVGHGGNDPGKVGVDKSLEKDINLQIAKRLRDYLEASDVEVAMTREDDRGLYSESDSRKKEADMRNRCKMIDEIAPDIVVSIHQNSYHQEAISGGQVFYYSRSEKGKELAEILQERFDYVLGEKNTRQAKANDSYYMLLHVKQPIVIVAVSYTHLVPEGDEPYHRTGHRGEQREAEPGHQRHGAGQGGKRAGLSDAGGRREGGRAV